MNLIELKKEYNYWNGRYKKAEDFFRENEVQECEKHIHLVNEILKNMSRIQIKIENILGRELNENEIWNGFEEIV